VQTSQKLPILLEQNFAPPRREPLGQRQPVVRTEALAEQMRIATARGGVQ
jgi:hypothetical protein